MKLFRVIVIIVAIGMKIPVQACSCKADPPPLEAAASSDLVFLGKAMGVGSAQGFSTTTYEFSVAEVFVGDIEATSLVVGSGFGSCSRAFQLGETYLVYAEQIGTDFHTHQCTRTSHINLAEFDLLVLRGLPIPETPVALSLSYDDGHVSVSYTGGYGRRWYLESSPNLSDWRVLEEFEGFFAPHRTRGLFYESENRHEVQFFRVREKWASGSGLNIENRNTAE